MKLVLKRSFKGDKYTIGNLYVDGTWFSNTIEDKDRGLTLDMSLDLIKKIKVPSETAIPTGTYKVIWTYSPRFKKQMPLINNVPGFSGIRIHSANTAELLEGCIAPGFNKVKGKVIDSRKTCEKLYSLLKGDVTITII